jgi:hypothetical protein
LEASPGKSGFKFLAGPNSIASLNHLNQYTVRQKYEDHAL